jgi:hypothetical protein
LENLLPWSGRLVGGISAAALAVLSGFALHSLWAYRRRRDLGCAEEVGYARRKLWLELWWTAIPALMSFLVCRLVWSGPEGRPLSFIGQTGTIESTERLTPAARGRLLFFGKGGCFACHSLDGRPLVGPTWKGLWGRTETLTNGTSVTVDEAYLRESILAPGAKVVRGFPVVMPSFGGTLDGLEIDALIAFAKAETG